MKPHLDGILFTELLKDLRTDLDLVELLWPALGKIFYPTGDESFILDFVLYQRELSMLKKVKEGFLGLLTIYQDY